MNKLYALILAASVPALCQGAETASRAYGIRVYSEATQSAQSLVSFSVDNPGAVRTEMELDGLNIKAATGHDGKYYMFQADDGILSNRLYCIDLDRMQLSVVADIDYKFNLAGNIIFTDASYDPNYGMIIASGYNVSEGEISGDEIDAPFGLYLIDPVTAEASKLSQQNERSLVAFTATGGYFMYGVDETSKIWNIDGESGEFFFDYGDLGFTPMGMQSMAWDYGKNTAYYAGYTADNSGNGLSKLYRMGMDENYEFTHAEIGSVGGNAELIGLYIDSDPANEAAPARVTDLTAVPGERGTLTATLSWTNPESTVGLEPLGAYSIKLYRDDELLVTLDATGPGERMTWTDNTVTTGMHYYSAVASNTEGDGDPTLTDPTWYGVDTPAGPASVNAVKSADGNSIAVTWTAPAAGEHGGWFDASQVTYNLVRQPGATSLLSASTATSYTDTAIGELHGYIYEVTASTAAGNGGTTASKPVVAGKPHAVPYAADFNDPDQVNQWTAVNADGDDYTWYAHTTGWAGTFDVFYRYNPENILNPNTAVDDWLISPAVTLEAGKLYVARYDLRLLGDLFPANLTLALGKAPAPEAMTQRIEELEGDINDIEWITHGVPFSVSETGTYHFGYQVRNAVPVQFYKFNVIETSRVDLGALSVSGNDLLTVGEPAELEVKVSNFGFEDVASYAIALTDAEGNTLSTTEITTPLASQKTEKVTVSWTPEKEGALEVRARVIAEGDAIADNDLSPAMKVNVLGNVTNIDITAGQIPTGYAPIYCSYPNSASQTIYTASKIGAKGKQTVKALIYYVYRFSGTGETEMNLDLSLANVDKADFNDIELVPASSFTKVFDSHVSLSPEQKTMTIVFDQPFEYDGGNLCVFARHSSETVANMMFYAEYVSGDAPHTAIYRGDEPFDFTQEVNGFYRDLPNVTLLVTPHESGIVGVESADGVEIVYSRQARVLNIVGGHDRCEIYSASGALIGSHGAESEISLDGVPAGVAIVRVTTANGVKTAKIVL